MDRGVWQATMHGVTKSQTQLSNFHFHFSGTVACICLNTYLENYEGLTHSKLLPLKELAETPTSLCWLHADLLHRTAVWKALKGNRIGRHLTIMTSARWPRSGGEHVLWSDGTRRHFISVAFLPQTHNPSPPMRNLNWGTFYTVCLKSGHVIKTQEIWRNCHS